MLTSLLLDLAWHTHMLFPNKYREFTIGYTDKFLNHDDTIPKSALQQYVENTNQAWKHRNEPKPKIHDPPTSSAGKTLKTKWKCLFRKNISTKVDPEHLFQSSYHAGTFEASPTYDINIDSKLPENDADNYNSDNASFHDNRELLYVKKREKAH